VLAVYVVVQQAEGHLIQPLVQRAVVEIPPVVTIAAIAAGGTLFGLLGIMLATPLAIALMVIVNMLYLDDRLGEGRHFPALDKVPEEAPGPAG
jgi:predicted PurR-regulated permease PerM